MEWIVYLLIAIALPTLVAQNNQKLCETEESRFCYTGLCPINECLLCGDNADCETFDPADVVPRDLYKRMRSLDLTYTGPETELTPDMFVRFLRLKSIKIRGNITSVAPGTFTKLPNLKFLTITDTKITSLPSRLFHNKSKLETLDFSNNQITEIPINIFSSIPNVRQMDLSHNPFNSCKSDNDTISPEFEMLKKLDLLKLSGYGSSLTKCQNYNKNYLVPLQYIRKLDLSESMLFYGDQRILSPLTNLRDLTINNVEPYKHCPALAGMLFQNMPKKLSVIVFKNWASADPINESCILTGDELKGLKELKKLSIFNARYGDKIFGNVLTSSIFNGFHHMKEVHIDWCGIASIERGALDTLSNMTNLGLGGNMLGPRKLEFYTNNQTSKLKELKLNGVGINNATYCASNLLVTYPLLKRLFLSDNHLRNIPDFGPTTNISTQIIELTLHDNDIERLSTKDGEKFCKIMRSLTDFKAERNRISDITGIRFCTSLRQLHIANNFIGKNQLVNFRAIGQLHRLEVLHLSGNKIKSLEPEFFINLTNLTILNLANNEIQSLANHVFINTPKLTILDLSNNILPIFNTSIVSNGLPKLRSLYLQSNQITQLTEELVHQISTNLTRITKIGLTGNPLTCSCNNYLSKWVINSSVIMQPKEVTCSTPSNPHGTTKVYSYEPDHFECHVKTPLIISAEVLAGVIVSLLLALPCYKYRWYLRHPKVVLRAVVEKINEVQFEETCEYDAFISYNTSSNSDSEWLSDKLSPAIEEATDGELPSQSKMKLYIVDRDAAIGSPKHTERCRAIENSRKIIILLTNSYLANPTCLSEADLVAGYQLVKGQHCYQPNRILVLVLGDLNEETIKPPVTSLLTENVIHVVDNEVKMKRIWPRIRKFISKPKYIYRKKQ